MELKEFIEGLQNAAGKTTDVILVGRRLDHLKGETWDVLKFQISIRSKDLHLIMPVMITDEMVAEAREFLLDDPKGMLVDPERRIIVFEKNIKTEVPRLLAIKREKENEQ